jgi:membrane protease YdiL (CAAX protease family)
VENNSALQTSPGFQTSSRTRPFRVGPTILVAVGVVVIFFAIGAAGSLYFFLTHGFDVAAYTRAAYGPFGIKLQAAIEIAIILYLLLVLPAVARTSLAGLGFTRPVSRDMAIVGGGIVAMIVVIEGLGTLLTIALHAHTPEAAIQVFLTLHTAIAKAGFALFAVVLAPFFEEFLFRLFLFNAMRAWWGFRPGAIVSALLFGFAHLQQGGTAVNVSLVVPLFCGGLILAWIYQRTGKAWASMLTHAGLNAVTLLAIAMYPSIGK